MNAGTVFFLLAQIAGAAAISTRVARLTILLISLSGFLAGAGFLSLGAEYLAIAQWLISSVATLGFLFFEMMFGNEKPWSESTRFYDLIIGIIAAGSICGIFFFGTAGTAHFADINWNFGEVLQPTAMGDLGVLMTRKYFLVGQVAGFLLLITIIGVGVLARPTRRTAESNRVRTDLGVDESPGEEIPEPSFNQLDELKNEGLKSHG